MCQRWLREEQSTLTAWEKSAEGKVGEGNEPEEKSGWPHIAEGPNGRKGEVASCREVESHPTGSLSCPWETTGMKPHLGQEERTLRWYKTIFWNVYWRRTTSGVRSGRFGATEALPESTG